MRLRDKVALITGAGSGIGRESALRFASEGARVVAADVDEAAAKDTVAQIEAQGGEALCVRADVSQASDCERMVAAAEARFGRLQILFNNAGIMDGRDDNAMATQLRNTAATHQRKGILHRRHDAPDPRSDDSLGARAGPSRMRARLEGAIQRCTSGEFASLCERVDFRMRLAGAFMCAIADDDALVCHDAGTDDGIRRGAPQSTTRLLECAAHPPQIRLRDFVASARRVRHHFSWNKAST